LEQLLKRLGETGLLDEAAAGRARLAMARGEPFEQAVLSADGLAEADLLGFLSRTLQAPVIDPEHQSPDLDLLKRFPTRLLVRHNLLPVDADPDAGTARVATARPCDFEPFDQLRLATGLDCEPVLAPSDDIKRALTRLLGVGADTIQALDAADDSALQVLDEPDEGDLDAGAEGAAHDASIVRFVNQMLTQAIERRATDVHLEPYEASLRLRFRVDGVLQEQSVPASLRRFHPAIVSRIKILSHLDIAEKRVPQDGRIKLRLGGREIDVRVSIIPMIHGEALVLRILARGDALLGTEYLGMDRRDRNLFDRVLALPHGICLVTGPTGSGKTTTLYAGLGAINDHARKIVTIEDPVEYQLPGVNQIQVNTKTGLTFARGLRAVLRHDPDVILVGEIRDRETAEIAVQASLTGHLVFSTLHTNDAPGAATRLIDMGVEPYLVASSVEVVLAQRLVRLICDECRTPLPEAEARPLRREFGDVLPETLFHGTGCRACGGTGYRGRQGVFEVMPVTDALRQLILTRAPAPEIRRQADSEGMRSLRDDGWRLVREGRTTVEELLRNTKDETLSLQPDEEVIA
jgi:general secretion pathway protein E/type IV pilus assembly protein PilB